jgi:hypothetical protein
MGDASDHRAHVLFDSRRAARRTAALACLVALAGCGVSEYLVTTTAASDAASDSGTTGDDPCANGEREPWESDIDCGGPICEACAAGLACKVDSDCASTICADGTCSDDPCDQPDPCPVIEAPCLMSLCDPMAGCVLITAADGTPCEWLADDPNNPVPGGVGSCLSGACVAMCETCEFLDGPCRTGVCNPINGECAVQWVDEGAPCSDRQGLMGQCVEGICEGIIETEPFYVATFDSPVSDWEFDPPWEIGPAMASMCSTQGIEDPGDDVSEGDDPGLAGLLIGECLPPEPLGGVCLRSLDIEAPTGDELVLRYLEIVDLPIESFATVEFFDGEVWQQIAAIEPMIPEWSERVLPLGEALTPVIQLRFCVTTALGRETSSGWSVDEIRLECPGCPP